MTHSSRLAARILLAIGGLAVAGCGSESSTSTDGCHPPVSKGCVSREQAWSAARETSPGGAGGVGGAGGSGGSDEIPDGCPGTNDIKSPYLFAERTGLDGAAVSFTGAEGETCCYSATFFCEGRPFLVEGVLRRAPLGRVADWG